MVDNFIFLCVLAVFDLSAEVTCRSGQVTCGGESPTRRCIPSRYFCDGDNDCGNGWDESDEVCGELFYVFVHGSICITHRLNFFLGGGTLDVGRWIRKSWSEQQR